MAEPLTPGGLSPSCLIIGDGSLATLVAVWREAVCRPGGGGVDATRPVIWSPTGLPAAAVAANERIARSAALEAPISGPLSGAVSGLPATLMLLAAGDEAARRGIGRVVWPVQFGTTDEADRLTQVGGTFDRALLAARLLSVDTRASSGMSVLIHTPFAELTDHQLMDLAADMDAPVGSAWWCETQSDPKQPPCGKCASCLRWLSAMRQAGVVAPIGQLPASLLEEKTTSTAAIEA